MGRHSRPRRMVVAALVITSVVFRLSDEAAVTAAETAGCPDAHHRLESANPDGLPRANSVVSKARVTAILKRNTVGLRRRFHYTKANVASIQGNAISESGSGVIARRYYVIRLTVPNSYCPTMPWFYDGVPLIFIT